MIRLNKILMDNTSKKLEAEITATNNHLLNAIYLADSIIEMQDLKKAVFKMLAVNKKVFVDFQKRNEDLMKKFNTKMIEIVNNKHINTFDPQRLLKTFTLN